MAPSSGNVLGYFQISFLRLKAMPSLRTGSSTCHAGIRPDKLIFSTKNSGRLPWQCYDSRMQGQLNTFNLLGVRVSVLTPELAVSYITDMVRRRARGYVCVAPVATIVDARLDLRYREVINNAALVTPDGMPVVWMGRYLGCAQIRRTYGPDLMLRLCDEGRKAGLKHYFYGATPEICDKLTTVLRCRFPGLDIVGHMSPPYMPSAQLLDTGIAGQINACAPDILWVGLGSPKQDFWMALNRSALDVPVMIGIGAAFDFLAGAKPQAPVWMRRSGLEWLFRLCCEPRRLWKRYLLGNVRFVWWVLLEYVLQGRRR